MIEHLLRKGVEIIAPDTVVVGDDVDPARIEPGVEIHPGCRIYGAETYIGRGSRIGFESPLTLRNCQLGRAVRVGGGFMEGTTMLDGASAGDGLHSRPGTLLEESSGVAHTVGLKQTILLPYVTLGSLINFCDVLMAGGTGPDNHSEVGSSYIHFNFTAHQDKATASLIGDVARGVFLDRNPIFLGGQGGMVGPCRVAYGTVVAAGSVLRRDVLEEDTLVVSTMGSGFSQYPYNAKVYTGNVNRIVKNCLAYMGNIMALRAWYRHVRVPVMGADECGRACAEGALRRLDEVWVERVKRLGQLAGKVKVSLEYQEAGSAAAAAQAGFVDKWPTLKGGLEELWAADDAPDAGAAAHVAGLVASGGGVVAAVKAAGEDAKAAVGRWLGSIADEPGGLFG